MGFFDGYNQRCGLSGILGHGLFHPLLVLGVDAPTEHVGHQDISRDVAVAAELQHHVGAAVEVFQDGFHGVGGGLGLDKGQTLDGGKPPPQVLESALMDIKLVEQGSGFFGFPRLQGLAQPALAEALPQAVDCFRGLLGEVQRLAQQGYVRRLNLVVADFNREIGDYLAVTGIFLVQREYSHIGGEKLF
ncbi:hypothetical protein ES708_08570 [subsurface metagenome]